MVTCTLALGQEIQVRGHFPVENQVLTAGIIGEDTVRKRATVGTQMQISLEFAGQKNTLDLILLNAEFNFRNLFVCKGSVEYCTIRNMTAIK